MLPVPSLKAIIKSWEIAEPYLVIHKLEHLITFSVTSRVCDMIILAQDKCLVLSVFL